MELREVEVYSETPNLAVVRAPGREFPGSVIQGDSLSILCHSVQRLAERLKELGVKDDVVCSEVNELQQLLIGRLAHYVSALDRHGLRTPFTRDPALLVPIALSEPESDEETE